ncbi:MAG TPA: glycosyltransferase family 39 protein [Planctomycetaceae bacterium]|nr:glycosyltransferase family 39 protein [Planctomycetaceae bacterium]
MLSRRALTIAIVGLLVLHAGLGIDAARRLTVTHDEYWHLPSGFLAWRTGRFDYDHLNPPLARLWATWPLLFTQASCDANIAPGDLFHLGHQFLADNRGSYEFYLALCRSMNVTWSVLAGLVLVLWSRALFGDKAALLTAALWAFCPTALANSSLVTPDAGGACLFVATLYAVWRYARRSDWRTAGIVGLLLGLAQLAKFTNLLLYPLALTVWWLARESDDAVGSGALLRGDARLGNVAKAMGRWLAIGAISLVVINVGYLFRGSLSPLDDYHFQSRFLQRIAASAGPLKRVPVPLPRDYLAGVDHQRAIMEAPHPVYLDGKWNVTGYPEYYLRALAYKLPHAAQGLCLLSMLFILFPGRQPRLLRTQLLLLLPVVLVIAVASSMGMQLGIRYVLPALPFLLLFAGQAARWCEGSWSRANEQPSGRTSERGTGPSHGTPGHRTRSSTGEGARFRTVLVVGAALTLPFSLRYHPHHLAYFNEWSGGPLGGRQHLLDSNLDWGQDLRGLKLFLDEQRIDDIGLAYFGMIPPAELGIRYHVPPRTPAPGWYAISAHFLHGGPHTVCNPDGSYRPADIYEFSWLRRFQPVARIGYSIDVFHVTPDQIRGPWSAPDRER